MGILPGVNTKETIIAQTGTTMNNFFNYARAVSADKVDWKPLDSGRSVLDMAQECAQSPDWGVGLMKMGGFSGFDDDMMQKMRDERAQWTSVDECERVCRERADKLFEAIRAFPDEKMDETIELPWGKKTFAWWEIMGLLNWNLTYHLGQVAYVQTLYGDHGYY